MSCQWVDSAPGMGAREPSRVDVNRKILRLLLVAMTTALAFVITTAVEGAEPKEAKEEKSLPTESVEARIQDLIDRMTVEEKIGQTALRGFSSRSTQSADLLLEPVKSGHVGAILNAINRDVVDQLQKAAVEESRLGIPILFARDVIHGFRTIFPIPLGQAASWHPELVEEGSRIAALEASTFGVRWTFAPMVDIARDARWGRIAESPGEDPFLAEVMAVAAVRGFQGDDPTSKSSLAACVKHFAAYGAAEGGRDYAAAFLPESQLRNVYLRPFKAAVDAGALTFMTAFNEINGVPATGHKGILQDLLRGEWGFDGFVVSDWESVTEMIKHGYSADPAHAAAQSLVAGTDMEMTSTSYEETLAESIRTGRVPMAALDAVVANILRVKMALGLFDDAARDDSRNDTLLAPEFLDKARQAAREGTVLLKNEGVLPLTEGTKVAVIGPLADAPHEQLGTWTFDGKKENSVTPLTAIREAVGEDHVRYVAGLTHSRDRSTESFEAALEAAEASDVVLFFGGEEAILSGEAHSRADLRMPGAQEALLKAVAATDKPVVLVLMAGRPLTLEAVLDDVDALLMAWHPGTMGGPAMADLLWGAASPSGRLPVTWPKTAGQSPIYYNHKNTGRPAPAPGEKQPLSFDDIPVGAWQSSLSNTSRYLDAGSRPQFPFGYGLTYSTFEYGELSVEPATVSLGDPSATVTVRATLRNTGEGTATEVAQLYVRDRVGSLTRPVRELKGFERVELGPGESHELRFEIQVGDLAFFDNQGKERLEAGDFDIWIGAHAADGRRQGRLTLTEGAASPESAP